MLRNASKIFLGTCLTLLLLANAPCASAQNVVVASCYSPSVSYYPASTVLSYSIPFAYSGPVVSYYAAPAVSYYAAPAVSYYAAPATAYYPAMSATTTRYGLFGRPLSSTRYYYPPVYVRP